MDWLSQTTNHRIKHKLNYGREKRVGPYPVDGFCSSTSTIFQFHGCYHHGHGCEITKRIRNEKWRQNRADKYKNTLRTNQYIQERGYRLNQIWECEFRNLKTSSKSLQNLINKKLPPFFRHYKRKVSESEILEAVYDGRIFGMIEVDICVPDEWPSQFQSQLQHYDYFEEMAPLFCTSDIPFEAKAPHMQHHVREKTEATIGGWNESKEITTSFSLVTMVSTARPPSKQYLSSYRMYSDEMFSVTRY